MKKTLGQIAFEAYDEDRGGVNHLGNRTPPWDELPEEIRDAWEAAAVAVADATCKLYNIKPEEF